MHGENICGGMADDKYRGNGFRFFCSGNPTDGGVSIKCIASLREAL